MPEWLLPVEHREFEQAVRDMAEPINAEIAKLEADFVWKRDYYDQHGECHSPQFEAIAERFTLLRNDALKRRETVLKPMVRMLAILPPAPIVVSHTEKSKASL